MNKKIIILIFGLIVFTAISYGVFEGNLIKTDYYLQENIFSTRNPKLTVIMKTFTYMGNWQTVLFICLSFVVLFIKKTAERVAIVFSILLSTLGYTLFKEMFGRERPDIQFHLINQDGLSFPSGHSMNGIVFYGLIVYFLNKSNLKDSVKKTLSLLIGILIILIGYSRIYLGVHYPSDVVAGFSIGLVFLMVALIIFEKFLQNRS